MLNSPWLTYFIDSAVLALAQVLAATPWLLAVFAEDVRSRWRLVITSLPKAAAVIVIGGAAGALALRFEQDRDLLNTVGRVYGAVLYLQLLLDFFAIFFGFLLLFWPQGASVALAAFREAVRQPMYWFILIIATIILVIMPLLPYYTFGEDLRMVKELGYDIIMLSAALFGVMAASASISEEIEGRTAITVMSKPVSRRQFLLGKFTGILMAALSLTSLLSLVYLLILWWKPIYDHETVTPPAVGFLTQVELLDTTLGTTAANLLTGVAWWFTDAVMASPGLILGFCQVMTLLAIAVALATRVPMVVNLVIALVVFFLGHLTPVLSQVSQRGNALVRFMAQLFDTLLPGLDLFNIGPVLTKDTLPPPGEFALYVASVAGYAALYTVIALLMGLILFEDRDLA